MKRKAFKTLFIGMILALASCTGKPVEGFEVPKGGYDGSEVNLKVYRVLVSGTEDIYTRYVEKFNEMYPNIHVEFTDYKWNNIQSTITTELSGDQEPNIAFCYPDHVASYNALGAKNVINLDNLISSKEKTSDGVLGFTKEQIADFIPGYYKEGAQFGDDLMYCLPFSKSTECLYYNKTFFDANNISVPDHWFTTSASDTTSVEAVARKIKALDPLGVPFAYDSSDNAFITLAEQQKAGYTSSDEDKHFIFDNETNKSTLKKFRELHQEGLFETKTTYGTYTNIAKKADGEAGSIYMSIGSSAGATYHRNSVKPNEAGIAPIPQFDKNNKKVISQGPDACIFDKANPQEVLASWLLLKYFTTNVEFQAELSVTSGYMPVLKSVENTDIYKNAMAKANSTDFIGLTCIKVCMEQLNDYFTSPVFTGSAQSRTIVGDLFNNVISKTDVTDVDKFINEAFAKAVSDCEYNV